MTATNKRLLISENHGDSNRYTPYMTKPDQHVTCFLCSVHVWSRIIRISCGPHIATLHTIVNSDGQSHYSRKKGSRHNPRGPTHRSLTDTGGGYNLGGADLPHTTPRPFQPAISTFHLRAPPGLQFNHGLLNQSLKIIWPPRGLLTTQPSTVAYIYA
jgi:hypothetical protein